MKNILGFLCVVLGCWGYNVDVSRNPTTKGSIGKELVHTLNDTGNTFSQTKAHVHRLCQGPLGCGSLRTNFTSTYNPRTRNTKALIGKELVHTLNDTDVHRFCQGPLGCGSLRTKFTSNYNATTRKINYVPPNHPTLDHSFRKLNPLDILGGEDYIERNKDNTSSLNEIDAVYYSSR